jgi:hypothetical protein
MLVKPAPFNKKKGTTKTLIAVKIPTTPEIEAAIKLAATNDTIIYKSHGKEYPRKKKVSRSSDDFIFPGCKHIQARNRSELPMIGHALRRTFELIARDELGYSRAFIRPLLGHAEEGIEAHYLPRKFRHKGFSVVDAQRDISRTIMALLKAKPSIRKKRAA